MVRIVLLPILGILMFSGCVGSSQNTSVCVKPAFPKPSQYTLDKIGGLKDKEVNLWMEELYKLNKKLSQEEGN